MPTPIQGVVGPNALSDGVNGVMRQGRTGEQIVSELHGRYYEQASRNGLFFMYNAAQTLTAAGTVLTGAILWNGNPKVNLVLQKVALVVSVTSASMTGIALSSTAAGAQTTAPSSQTAATRFGSCLLSGASPTATAMSAGTTLATTSFFPLLHNTVAINTVGIDSTTIDLEGSFLIPPFTAVALAALGAASAASAVTSTIIWEEVANGL